MQVIFVLLVIVNFFFQTFKLIELIFSYTFNDIFLQLSERAEIPGSRPHFVPHKLRTQRNLLGEFQELRGLQNENC